MTAGQIAIKALIMGFIISLVVITGFAYTTLLERKVLARLQAPCRSQSRRLHTNPPTRVVGNGAC